MKFKRFLYSLFCLSLVFILSGCLATTNQFVDLKDEIYQLQLKLNEVQKNQADLSSKMDTLTTSMDSLISKLDETTNSMSNLGSRLDDVESNLSRKMNRFAEPVCPAPVKVSTVTASAPQQPAATPAPAAPAPASEPAPAMELDSSSSGIAPSRIYQLAYSDFSKGKYELAAAGFVSYLNDYSKGELADEAHYYLGESYYGEGKWSEAQAEFDATLKNFPKSGLVPAARLKKALCLEQMSNTKDMLTILKALVKDFPDSPEANTAKEKLNTYRNNDK